MAPRRFTPAAKKAFVEYISSHRKARTHETRCSGVKNITVNIDAYFTVELKERDHADVVKMIQRNGGVFNKKAMNRWIEENYRENYVNKETYCD